MHDLRPGRLFVFGLGYSMTRLARRLRDLGWQVAGTTRDADRLERLHDEGFEAHAFGPDQPLDTTALAGTTHLIQSISPEDSGDPVVPALAEALRALPQLRWVGYLSTPSVYGDRDGAWIDESADPTPGSPRGWKRLEAERAWFGAFQSTGVAVQVFRLAGIYGPGRCALDQLRHGRARRIDRPGQVFNRIHVDDIGSVLMASMRQPRCDLQRRRRPPVQPERPDRACRPAARHRSAAVDSVRAGRPVAAGPRILFRVQAAEGRPDHRRAGGPSRLSGLPRRLGRDLGGGAGLSLLPTSPQAASARPRFFSSAAGSGGRPRKAR
ncbi:hypothetical protein [Inquilinus sp. CA228]|uniref:hypothetical protein n=1 Tax=Inquilinus sp. CA228 TaxID=3455609 RepID=UPI003F8D219E